VIRIRSQHFEPWSGLLWQNKNYSHRPAAKISPLRRNDYFAPSLRTPNLTHGWDARRSGTTQFGGALRAHLFQQLRPKAALNGPTWRCRIGWLRSSLIIYQTISMYGVI